MQKSFKLDQALMNNVEKKRQTFFVKFGIHVLSLCKDAIWESFESEHRKLTNTSAKYTVLMLRVHQNGRKNAFGRSPLYHE